jgi:hypothetical protein
MPRRNQVAPSNLLIRGWATRINFAIKCWKKDGTVDDVVVSRCVANACCAPICCPLPLAWSIVWRVLCCPCSCISKCNPLAGNACTEPTDAYIEHYCKDMTAGIADAIPSDADIKTQADKNCIVDALQNLRLCFDDMDPNKVQPKFYQLTEHVLVPVLLKRDVSPATAVEALDAAINRVKAIATPTDIIGNINEILRVTETLSHSSSS